MRRSPRSFGPAILAAFLAFMPVTGVFAEDGEFDATGTDDSQIKPAGAAADPQHTGKNLNTIPEDGLGAENVAGPDNLLVRQLLAARPKEDIVICVAGCFSGRDRVVYAQPAEKLARVPVAASQSSLSVAPQNLSSNSACRRRCQAEQGRIGRAASQVAGSERSGYPQRIELTSLRSSRDGRLMLR